MPFLGNIAGFGTERVGAAGTSAEWGGNIAGLATQQVGPIRITGASKLAFSGLFSGAGTLSVNVEVRIGKRWRVLATRVLASGTADYFVWTVSARDARIRATAGLAGTTVDHLMLFATGT